MSRFIVNRNAQPTGEHEVHNATNGCEHMPDTSNQIDLGYHATCHGAVTKAKSDYPSWEIDGCYYCCNECHTR